MKKLLENLENYSIYRGLIIMFMVFSITLLFVFVLEFLIALWDNEIPVLLEEYKQRFFAIWKKVIALYIVTSLMLAFFIRSRS